MTPFIQHQGVAASLPMANIDTDVIVRVERLVALDPGQFGPYAFEVLRYRPDGSENPDFVLNREPWRHASILLCGPNFGCGRSRESAVWALADFGIRCVIGTTYGDIFRANCLQNGVLPISLDAAALERVRQAAEASPGRPLVVDLRQRLITDAAARLAQPFEIDDFWREALMAGADQIQRTLRLSDRIDAFQQAHRARAPWAYDTQIQE